MLYRYIALNTQGKKQKGVLETSSLQEAKEKLRSQGVIVLKLLPFQKKGDLFSKKKKLQGELLVTFTSQLAELTSAKIPLYESLMSIEEMYRNEAFHSIVLGLSEDIKKGISLSLALSKYPSSFKPLYISMIKAGEAVGTLDKTLLKLSSLLLKQHQLKKKLTTTLLYPALLFSFSLFVIGTLLIFVIPSLEALFAEREVNGFTKIVFSVSHFVTQKYPFYLPGMAAIFASLFIIYKKKKRDFYEAILKLPILKKLVIETAVARFSRTLSTLLEGGVAMKEALGTARGVLGFSLLEMIILEAEKKIIEGSLLSVELKKAPLIPPLVSRMVAIGEEGGNMASMLGKVADFYEDEVEKKVSRLLALSAPMILLIMGALVGVIMMAVLLPLTDTSMFIGD